MMLNRFVALTTLALLVVAGVGLRSTRTYAQSAAATAGKVQETEAPEHHQSPDSEEVEALHSEIDEAAALAGPATIIAELAKALRRMAAGERVVDPALALTALSEGGNPLTPREREVLAASLDGASVAEIAARLVISEGTTRNHISTAIQKLSAQNRTEAGRFGGGEGLAV